jgi:hypothetical protein
MKSQVGLGRLYPDGRFDNTQEPPAEQVADAKHDEAGSAPAASELISVVVHVEKAALNELLQKSAQP